MKSWNASYPRRSVLMAANPWLNSSSCFLYPAQGRPIGPLSCPSVITHGRQVMVQTWRLSPIISLLSKPAIKQGRPNRSHLGCQPTFWAVKVYSLLIRFFCVGCIFGFFHFQSKRSGSRTKKDKPLEPSSLFGHSLTLVSTHVRTLSRLHLSRHQPAKHSG